MWQSIQITPVCVTADRLWQAAAESPGWPGGEHAAGPGGLRERPDLHPGDTVAYRPPGGCPVRLTVSEVRPPYRLVTVAWLPLAAVWAAREFEPTAAGSRVVVRVWVTGPFAYLWRRLVGEPTARELGEQTRRLIRRAGRSEASPPAQFPLLSGGAS